MLFVALVTGFQLRLPPRAHARHTPTTLAVGQDAWAKLVGEREYADLTENTQGGGVTVVWFSGSACKPCRKMRPIFETLIADWPTVTFAEVNFEQNGEGLFKALKIRVRSRRFPRCIVTTANPARMSVPRSHSLTCTSCPTASKWTHFHAPSTRFRSWSRSSRCMLRTSSRAWTGGGSAGDAIGGAAPPSGRACFAPASGRAQRPTNPPRRWRGHEW